MAADGAKTFIFDVCTGCDAVLSTRDGSCKQPPVEVGHFSRHLESASPGVLDF